MSADLRQNHRRCKKHFDRRIGKMPRFSIGYLVYVDVPSSVILINNINADKNKKLLPRAYDPFRVLHITDHTLTEGENGSHCTFSIDRATTVAGSGNHPRRSNELRTSFEGNGAPGDTNTPLVLRQQLSTLLNSRKTFTKDRKDTNI